MRLSKTLAALTIALAMVGMGRVAAAADPLPVPPYVVTNTQHIIAAVEWEPAAVLEALPPGVEPVKGENGGFIGGVNIYYAGLGYGMSEYSAVYFFVEVKGYSDTDGGGGQNARMMLAGAYGPDKKIARILREFHGMPVRTGVSRHDRKGHNWRATGLVGGKEVVTVEINTSEEKCMRGLAGKLTYLGIEESTGQILINQFPFTGDVCPAELVSLKVTAPAGDPFARFKPIKALGAVEFANGNFGFARPLPKP